MYIALNETKPARKLPLLEATALCCELLALIERVDS